MKRTTTTIVVVAACALSLNLFPLRAETNVVGELHAARKVDCGLDGAFRPFQLHTYARLDRWIELQAYDAGLKTYFDDAALEGSQYHVLLIASDGLESLPKRYFLGWMFHLFGLVAHVEDDTLVVTKTGEMADLFKCFQESDGAWRKKIDAALRTEVSITGHDWAVGQALSFLAHKTGAPLLLDRPLMANESNLFPPPLDRPLDLAVTNAPFAEVLTTILSERGLTNRVQGGVVFIFKQETREAKPEN